MKILALLIVLLSPSLVVAQEFDTYSIKAEVSQDIVVEEVEITFSNISELSYTVGGSIEDLQVHSRDGSVSFNLEKGPHSYLVVSGLSGKGHLRLTFKTDAPLLRRDDGSEALFKVRYPLDVKNFSLRLTLPENTIPTSTRDAYSIFPSPTEMFIEEGRYNIVWERQGIAKGEELTFTASFSPPRKSLVPYILVSMMLVISTAGLLVYRRKKEELFMKGLDVDERRVVRLLKAGKEDQKEVQEELGFSKVKMTRVVQKLEGKGLIGKEKVGRRNKLFLK
jgi:uncharacterized membrane protein